MDLPDDANDRATATIDDDTDKRPALSAQSEKRVDGETATVAPTGGKAAWGKWYAALKSVLPVYIGVHLAFFVTSFLSVLFVLSDFSKQSMPLFTLWQAWHHWDTGNFLVVAVHGYTAAHQTAFFPLYPIFERIVMFVTGNPFTAGLIISDVAGLVMLVVLYRLVEEDFDAERAYRTVLYLSVFPTAFFLAAAYNESLFICFALFSFYYMRHGNWWLAGLFGFLATLTRSSGLFLVAPFCYEYVRQVWFGGVREQQGGGDRAYAGRFFGEPQGRGQAQGPHLTSPHPLSLQGERELPQKPSSERNASAAPTIYGRFIRRPVFGGSGWLGGTAVLGMPAAVVVFAVYCYFQFHDALAFLHAQVYWHPRMHVPGEGMVLALRLVTHSGGLLNFQAIHNLLDLIPDLFVLGLIMLCFVGPWRLPRNLWAYGFYAAALYIFFQLYPTTGIFPLLSVARYLLEVFPAFIILASLGRMRLVHTSYLMVSCATLFFLLSQFLIGRWVL
jgi:hypothetical protein